MTTLFIKKSSQNLPISCKLHHSNFMHSPLFPGKFNQIAWQLLGLSKLEVPGGKPMAVLGMRGWDQDHLLYQGNDN